MRTLAPVLRTFGQAASVAIPAIPGSFAITNPGKGGILSASWTGSYNTRDTIVFYNAADDSEIGRGKADDLADIIGSLVNGTLYTIYAKATADNVNFSAATSNATGTPTGSGSIVSQTTVGTARTNTGVR